MQVKTEQNFEIDQGKKYCDRHVEAQPNKNIWPGEQLGSKRKERKMIAWCGYGRVLM